MRGLPSRDASPTSESASDSGRTAAANTRRDGHVSGDKKRRADARRAYTRFGRSRRRSRLSASTARIRSSARRTVLGEVKHEDRSRKTHARVRRAQAVRQRRTVILIGVLVAIPSCSWRHPRRPFALAGCRPSPPSSRTSPPWKTRGDVPLAQTTQIYAADGTLLAYLHGEENRTVISGKQIPDVLRHAVVAIEDERFYQHNGVDLEGFVRALVTNIQSQGVEEGFSTITMQLVGNLYLDRTDISLARKFNEMALAWQIRAQVLQERDPRHVPQHRLLRLQRLRRRGGGPHLLRQGPHGSHPGRGRAAGRSAAGADRVLAPPATRKRP